MNYLLKNNRGNGRMWKPVIWTFVILAVAGFFYFFAPKFANQGLLTIARPIWTARDYISDKFANLVSAVTYKENLASLNLSLSAELDEARVALIGLDEYKNENEKLKKLLGRSVSEKRLLAVILAKPSHSTYDTLILDVGESLGVKVGDWVLFGDFLIGKVKEVYSNYSKAVLMSSPGEILKIQVGQSGISTDAFGRGGGNFVIKLPKEIEIKEGDLIKSAGLQTRFFGVVESIEQTETGSFQFILFKLPVNINTLEWVEIIPDGDNKISNL